MDTHAHVIGTENYVDDRRYTPTPASADEYLAMLRATGMTHGVLIQTSVHGTDNSVMLDVLTEHPDMLRGIAVVPANVTDRTLATLKASGCVGIRLNIIGGGGIGDGLAQLDRYEAICRELDWHIQFLVTPAQLLATAPRLRELTVPYVLDHLGDVDVTDGTASPRWAAMLDLMRSGAWTKLSGAFRLATTYPFAELRPFVRELLDVAPERCVWGSDWPHVAFWGTMPNVGDLLDLLADWAPDSAQRDAVLAGNPQRLYGFPPPPAVP
ncbi:amidohydrolase family protein [Sciscionella sediminilitoris]|uniref:amidohydrolase family protein n=1 Tax=Sciscionella sediminilitoris TaxID=1445613 RepID=UPI0018D0EE4D|nr:amidohydrolase family protein [Sciscionella sp. SE31]